MITGQVLITAATVLDNDEVLASELRDAFGMGADETAYSRSSSAQFSSSRRGATRRLPLGVPLVAKSRLADFEIIDELGRGGMGVVYRARQLSLDREVALKVLPSIAPPGSRVAQRFQTEAKAAARLNHTNVVPIFAQGETDGHYFYAMKLVEGVPLDAVIRSHPELLSSTNASKSGNIAQKLAEDRKQSAEFSVPLQTPQRDDQRPRHQRSRQDFCFLAGLMAEVADGLAHAHANGILHRDIKPHNLIFGADGHVHITDFGLAYIKGDTHMTMTGEIMGTPSYVSPEQARGEVGSIDDRTDIFSLGVTLYELATGRRPFEGETREQILHAVCDLEPKRPRAVETRIPPDFETICLKALEKRPADRYQSAAAISEDLRRFSEGRPILARRTGLAKQAVKWMRRRPALSSALAAAAALIAVTIGWGISAASAQRVQAEQHLEAAYHQMVHLNYRRPALARDDLAQALALGTSGAKLEVVQAIFEMADFEVASAIVRLDRLLVEDPQNVEAMYVLAWAQRNDRQFEKSRETRRNADAISGPQTPEQCFFRALAANRTDTEIAVDSFGLAVKLSAADERHFPQAILHLARAHNQQMYKERKLGPFAEAELNLKQLIKHEQYGGYPHYLLAITHRVAGEIHEASPAPGSAESALEMFEAGLRRAREGQVVAIDEERPITAEAFILERMGRIEEARDARSRAIEAADSDRFRCEGYHYRWRLEYWLGRYDEALADIERHAQCLPDDRHYGYLYPALVHAEMGQMDTALAHIARLLSDEPNEAEVVLLAVAGLRLLGQGTEAHAVLADRWDTVAFSDPPDREIPRGWLETLYEFCAGEASIEDLEDLAFSEDGPRQTMGEAHFHAATVAIAHGDRRKAQDGFRRSYRAFDDAMGYTYQGKLFLGMIQNDATWPPWIPAEPYQADSVGGGVGTLRDVAPREGD
ncbi:MAG: protein kinase [Planctomycetes bacterium]|nr:protein kinase [Planctomycetota bacterium]